MENYDEKKTKYFVIAIVLLIVLGVILIIHFNNRSLESGDDEKTTKKTTEKVTTTEVVTKKKLEKEEAAVATTDDSVYKSVVDKDNKLVYNYKLTDEITESDNIISKVVDIDESLQKENVIGLFDISLYDANGIKKTVKNSLINISIPITGELIGYDEYKVVYIVDNVIQDEDFETTVSDGYINFYTTHLSLFGIIGIKNETKVTPTPTNVDEEEEEDEEETVDLSKVAVSFKSNNSEITNKLTNKDKVTLEISNADAYDYEVLYAIKSIDATNVEYKEYSSETGIVFDYSTPKKFTISVKIVVGEETKVIESNQIEYSIQYSYQNDAKEGDEIGVLPGNDYSNKEDNYDITVTDKVKPETEEAREQEVAVKLNGNVYLVEETDIDNLEINGYLYISNEDEIPSITYSEKINNDNIYTINIVGPTVVDGVANPIEFMFNGVKYQATKDNNGVVIKKWIKNEVTNPETEEVTDEGDYQDDENFKDNFTKDVEYDISDENELVITNKELKEDETTEEVEETPAVG